jgi:ribonuclease HI
MDLKSIPILHVDGSLSEYVDKQGVLHQVGGIGGYLVVNGKIIDKFHKTLDNMPHINHHEDYAIIEGLKWVKAKNFDMVKVKTDSMSSVSLFNNQKKSVSKEDKFFLLQFMMLEFSFEVIEISYVSRNDDDLSHQLSRHYLKDMPKDVVRLHHDNPKKKCEYNFITETKTQTDNKVQKVLYDSMKEIHTLLMA